MLCCLPALLLLGPTQLPEEGKLDAPPADARARYPAARRDLEADRRLLAAELRRARGPVARGRVLDRAGERLLAALTRELLPAWYGTTWSFSGTSTTPGQGSIACGMFVGTVLSDAGFRVDRIGMGRLASEHIALSLTHPRHLRRYSDRPPAEVGEELRAWGPGLYLVGLDYHAGFAWVDEARRLRFIHSTVLEPGKVVSEPLLDPNPFTHSRYRVLARLLGRDMARRWLEEEPFALIRARS